MGRISEHKIRVFENPETGEVTKSRNPDGFLPCSCCGEVPSHGGNHLPTGPVICSRCVVYGDLNGIGMALGDAILDYYKDRHALKREDANVNTIVRSMLNRIELATYRAVAVGFEHLTFRQPYHGLKGKPENET